MRNRLVYVALLTGVAQSVSFMKTLLVARYFGVSADLDGFNLAFVLPLFVSSTVAGVLQTGLFTVHVQVRLRAGEDAVARLERVLFWGLLSFGAAVSVAFYSFGGQLVGAVAREASAQAQASAIYVFRFAAFAVVLNILGDYLAFVLALRGRFVIAAAAPIANAVFAAALLVAWPSGGLTNLALGTVLGFAIQLGIVLKAAQSVSFAPFGKWPAWEEVSAELREIARLGGWMLPGVVFAAVTVALPPFLASSFGDGAVAAFGYAFRFHQSATQLLIMAASPLILARFSELVATGNWQALERLQSKAFWVSMALGSLALLFVAVFGEAFLRLLFVHGRFDSGAAHRVATHWLWLTCALGPALYGSALAKRFQAAKAAKELSVLTIIGTAVLVTAVWALRSALGEAAVAQGVAISTIVITMLLAVLLRSAHFKRAEGRPVQGTTGLQWGSKSQLENLEKQP